MLCFDVRPYTPMHGLPLPVWFDRPEISPSSAEDVDNINEMCDYLDGLVAQEWNNHGIPTNRIIVGKNTCFFYFLCCIFVIQQSS